MSSDDTINENATSAAAELSIGSLEAGPIQEADPSAPPAGVEAGGVYRLQPGDTLELVAEKLYGDASRAEDIFAVNREAGILVDPGTLPINREILLP